MREKARFPLDVMEESGRKSWVKLRAIFKQENLFINGKVWE